MNSDGAANGQSVLARFRTMQTVSFDILKMLSAALLAALVFSTIATVIVLILAPAAEAKTYISSPSDATVRV